MTKEEQEKIVRDTLVANLSSPETFQKLKSLDLLLVDFNETLKQYLPAKNK